MASGGRTPHPEAVMNYVDAHAHVWTSDVAHYPLGKGWKKEAMSPASFTPEDFLKLMKPAGVTRANLIQMSYYYPTPEAEPEKGKDASGLIVNGFDNSYMLDMIALYPDAFVGTAATSSRTPCPSWTGCARSTRTRRSSSTTCAASASAATSPTRTWTPCARWPSTSG
jgi:hypothetical protein